MAIDKAPPRSVVPEELRASLFAKLRAHIDCYRSKTQTGFGWSWYLLQDLARWCEDEGHPEIVRDLTRAYATRAQGNRVDIDALLEGDLPSVLQEPLARGLDEHGHIRVDEVWLAKFLERYCGLSWGPAVTPLEAVIARALEPRLEDAFHEALAASARKGADASKAAERAVASVLDAARRFDIEALLPILTNDTPGLRVAEWLAGELGPTWSTRYDRSASSLLWKSFTARCRIRLDAARVSVDPSAPIRPYTPADTYALGDRIEHAKFGTGHVVRVDTALVEVAFTDGTKRLAHARH